MPIRFFNSLHTAIDDHDEHAVESLLKDNPNFADVPIKGNEDGYAGCNALHLAKDQGYKDLVQLLSK